MQSSPTTRSQTASGSSQEVSTLSTARVWPRAGTVKPTINNHGVPLSQRTLSVAASPTTRSQTASRKTPLYNDGTSRVRGIAERTELRKIRYAKEHEIQTKVRIAGGPIETVATPLALESGIEKTVENIQDQDISTCPWEYGNRSHRVAEDIMEAGQVTEGHCRAKSAHPRTDPAEECVGNAHEDLGDVGEDSRQDYAALVGEFHKGAYYKHHAWKEPIRSIVPTLLHECVEEDEVRATEGIAALQLLPGLVEHCRGQRKKKAGSEIQLLRDIQGAPDKPREILRLARSWSQKTKARTAEWPQPSVEKMRTRIESLAATGRLSAAATALRSMDELMKGNQPPPPASPEEIARRIAELHPPEDERDLLPDEADDPPVETAFQLTADQVRQRFYTIQQKNTAAGCTGWTNEWLQLLGDDRSDPDYTHTVTPPSPIHVAFTAFFNKIPQGRITGEGRELLVTARLIMIPKPQGGLRPIRIECAIMRLMSATAAALARVIVGPSLRPIQLGGGTQVRRRDRSAAIRRSLHTG